MKKLFYITLLCFTTVFADAQSACKNNHSDAFNLTLKKEKGKAIKYNAFGMGVFPSDHLMVGGNHLSFRKFGGGLSWRVGVRNIQLSREGFSDILYDTAANNGYLTGNTRVSYSFGGTLNFAIAITKKIPLYIGIGAIRERHFAEIQAPFKAPGDTEWQIDPHQTQFKLNFTAGVFIPVFSNVVLNIGYDHLPQTIFAGIAISGPFNYEDIDMW